MFKMEELINKGFKGFRTVKDLATANDRQIINNQSGIYLVFRDSIDQPTFLKSNPGGRFKGKDPSVSISELQKKWVDDAVVLYVGKANKLRQRIGDLIRFSQGTPVGHWGGRYLWQIANSEKFLIAWLENTKMDPHELESQYLHNFEEWYGKLPFANIVRGKVI